MKLSFIVATSENNIIGNGPDIPWKVRGEQQLFKALTFNQWVLVGRKTFESMGALPDRKFAVVSRSQSSYPDALCFPSVEDALKAMQTITDHLIVAGGGQLYSALIETVDVIHRSVIHRTVKGNVRFPEIPSPFSRIFSQTFESNINYTYEIWEKNPSLRNS